MDIAAHPRQKIWQEKEPFAYAFPYRSWDSAMSQFTFPLHWHKYHEILQVNSGGLYAFVDGKTYEASAGDIVIIADSLLHGFFPAKSSALARIFQFDSKIFAESGVELGGGNYGESIFMRKPLLRCKTDGTLYEKAASLTSAMFDEYAKRSDGYRLFIKSRLYELSLLFLREIPPTKQESVKKGTNNLYVNERLTLIMSFIFQNYDNCNITLDDAADAAFISKFHFTRFFKEYIGQSFHSYLSMVRVSHAVEALKKTDASITDIAYNCGFASIKTFNRVFKIYSGKSPSEYRDKALKINTI